MGGWGEGEGRQTLRDGGVLTRQLPFHVPQFLVPPKHVQKMPTHKHTLLLLIPSSSLCTELHTVVGDVFFRVLLNKLFHPVIPHSVGFSQGGEQPETVVEDPNEKSLVLAGGCR